MPPLKKNDDESGPLRDDVTLLESLVVKFIFIAPGAAFSRTLIAVTESTTTVKDDPEVNPFSTGATLSIVNN